MEPNNGLSGAKIALLVDFDNVVLGLEDPGFDIELVVNALRERGTIVLGRVYGDWYRHNRHRRRLMEQGLELVETPAFGPVIKNSADIRIALDGFEIGLTQSHIDTFAIVSGDSDFLPLIKKLQSLGRRVLVICGNRFTSDMLRRNCNEFISYENLLAQSVGATEDATTLEGAFALLHRAMEALRERGTEIRGSGVKQMMIQLNPVFSERTFGCTQFRQFLQKAVQSGVVKLGPRDKTSGEFHVLLPDEDEAPIQQRMDKRDQNRARRDEKIASIVSRIEAVPVPDVSVEEDDNIGVEVELDAVADSVNLEESDDFVVSDDEFDGGHVFADDAFGYDPETMAEARTESVQEIAQNTIARTELLSRGLRPSTRRFSGRGGRPPLEIGDIEETVPAEVEEEAPVSEIEEPEEVPASEVSTPEAAGASNRRLRTRRRRRSASGQITVVSDEAIAIAAEHAAAIGDEEGDAEETTIGSEGAYLASTDDTVAARDTFGDDETLVAVEPQGTAFESDSEPPLGGVLPAEADVEAIAEVQGALDALAEIAPHPAPAEPKTVEITVSSEPTPEPAAESQPLADSEGVTVEAVAPPLPEGSADLPTANPSGQPAVQAALEEGTAPKPKRRRPSRTKKTAPVEADEASTPPVVADMADANAPADAVTSEVPPAVESLDIKTEALPVGSESPVGDADAGLATESTDSVDAIADTGTAATAEPEAAPAKPKRRRAPRAKKADTPPAE